MPKLDSPMHLNMLRRERPRFSLFRRRPIYGLQWGDPDEAPNLAEVRRRFVDPYISAETTALEIGPGGGRWTRYMLKAKRLYAVDYHQKLLDELRKTYDRPNMVFIKNNGTDFPGVPDASIDFLFAFGVFVHLDIEIIGQYLGNMRRTLKPDAVAVIQYSDKNKPEAQANKGFSENRPELMVPLVKSKGYRILEEDRDLMSHSSIVRFSI